MTLVDGLCACRCPDGLDPATGCADVLGADQSWRDVIAWPRGQYALPKTTDGCPAGDDVFKSGSVTHTASGRDTCEDTSQGCSYWIRVSSCLANTGFMYPTCPVSCDVCETFGSHGVGSGHKTGGYHLAGDVNEEEVEHQFCVKDGDDVSGDVSGDDVTWPAGGEYCLFKKGECPEGFQEGSVTFTDELRSGGINSVEGELPDGEFGESSTKFDFCCSKAGYTGDEIVVPSSEPFSLLRKGSTSCQSVRGMHVYSGHTVIKQSGSISKSGTNPVVNFDSGKKEYSLPYCYYVPTDDDCGGVIDLTKGNPTASISGSGGPHRECNWLIAAPEGSRVILNFDSFNVAKKSNGDCIDEVKLRYNRLAQIPQNICGDKYEKSTTSIYNSMLVTWSTHDVGESSFDATVSLLHPEDSCYNTEDRGTSYDGTVSVTRTNKQCLQWFEVMHCDHNPFMAKYLFSDLVDNYCRNPDSEDGLRPWCYYEADGCKRDYCDVCGYENVYDTNDLCEEMKKQGICEAEPEEARKECAKTCAEFLRSIDTQMLPECGPPDSVSDGDIISEAKSSYSVGDVVTYRCSKSDQPTTRDRRCLTSGHWSALNFVCTACEDGWVLRDGSCYMYEEQKATYDQAVVYCGDLGATLAMAKTEDEAAFLNSFHDFNGVWVAANDKEDEGSFKWSDGSALTWAPWEDGEPDNWYDEDCVYMDGNGYFSDKWCPRDNYNYVCVKPAYDVTSCDDVSNICVNLFLHDPTLCDVSHEQHDFMATNCKKTCGQCSPVSCDVEPATDNAHTSSSGHVSQGGHVLYECQPGKLVVSGDAVRGCLATGELSGQPLECEADTEVKTELVGELAKVATWGTKMAGGYTYTGNMPQFRLNQDGKIVRWEFYSDRAGKGAFQVWRPTDTDNTYQLVGQNEVITLEGTFTKEVAESQQIEVKAGDFLGIYYDQEEKFGVGYTKCTLFSDYPEGAPNLRKTKTKVSSASDYIVGNTYDVKKEKKEKCRYYKLQAVIKT